MFSRTTFIILLIILLPNFKPRNIPPLPPTCMRCGFSWVECRRPHRDRRSTRPGRQSAGWSWPAELQSQTGKSKWRRKMRVEGRIWSIKDIQLEKEPFPKIWVYSAINWLSEVIQRFSRMNFNPHWRNLFEKMRQPMNDKDSALRPSHLRIVGSLEKLIAGVRRRTQQGRSCRTANCRQQGGRNRGHETTRYCWKWTFIVSKEKWSQCLRRKLMVKKIVF